MTDIHIVAPFYHANGGDWRAIDLYLYLQNNHKTWLWSPRPPNETLQSKYPIHEMKPYRGQHPTSGILIIWGALTEIGQWYDYVTFEKVILVHNLFAPDALYQALHRLALNGKHVEIRYVSKMLKRTVELPGEILYLAPHIERFQPQKQITPKKSFTVGRVSRDVIAKHHYEDPCLYRKLADSGISVKITGGTCLAPWIQDIKNIDLLPETSQDLIPQALSDLDCFYYRTSIGLKEAFGVVVIEAMLCGLPVVCHYQGGYAEIIKNGVNGFLFQTTEEAEKLILDLQQNILLRNQISMEARKIGSQLRMNMDLSDLAPALEGL